MADAARLLRIRRPKLDGWVRGYVRENGTRHYPPVLAGGSGLPLSFADLVELMYVREFRAGGVSLQKIRLVADKYGRAWGTPYPFATRRFATDGRNLLLQEGGEWSDALHGQRILFENVGKTLVHTGDFTSEWRPLGATRSVVLDPGRAFGKPIEAISGAHTFVLWQAIQAGDSVQDVAWWYGIPEESVKDAEEFERGLLRS